MTALAPARPAVRAGGADPRPHAVVIGSGFGGLAAAVRLGARGYRVTVLERLATLGGRARVHREGGFVFDAGPTIVTAPQLFEELWALCGRRFADDVDLRPVDPFYRILFADGSRFDTSGDPQRMRAEVARLSPGDLAGYERFLAYSRAVYETGFERLAATPFDRWTDMARVVPRLLALKGWRSVHAAVSAHVRDERLRAALGFHPLFVGGNPFTATAVLALIPHLERQSGVHFAMGGTGRLVAGLAGLVEGQGGRIRTDAEVAAITTDRRRVTGVRLAGGETIPAAVVVSNADAVHTLGRLVPPAARRRWSDRRIAALKPSMSLFVWYFGTRRRYPDVGHHTILMGPRYRGLLDDIFRRKVLAEDFSLYLHRPTATDPSMAPAGCDAFYALAPVPNLEAGVDWAKRAEPFRAAIAAELERRLLPGLGAAVAVSRVTTPANFAADFLADRGAAFGPQPILTQSAWFRPHNRSEDLDGLYLVGAGTHPGAGIPGVLSSARILDTVVPHARAAR